MKVTAQRPRLPRPLTQMKLCRDQRTAVSPLGRPLAPSSTRAGDGSYLSPEAGGTEQRLDHRTALEAPATSTKASPSKATPAPGSLESHQAVCRAAQPSQKASNQVGTGRSTTQTGRPSGSRVSFGGWGNRGPDELRNLRTPQSPVAEQGPGPGCGLLVQDSRLNPGQHPRGHTGRGN